MSADASALCTRACSKASRPMSTTAGSSISCGTNSLGVPALRAVLMFWHEYQALQQLLKEEESNKEDEEGGKGVEEDKKE